MHALKSLSLAALAVAFFASSPALAEDSDPAAPPPEKTAVVVDEDAGVIRFFIDGQEKMRLDAAGLHVRENIDYGGMITDYGRSGFDDRAGWKEYELLTVEGRDAE